MNFCLSISDLVSKASSLPHPLPAIFLSEQAQARYMHSESSTGISPADIYSKCQCSTSECFCLCQAMEVHQLDPFDALELVKAQDGRFLGGGDVRIGEFILLVDSDTRIPVDCILPTVSELLQSPRVGFTQHLITPMQVTPPASSLASSTSEWQT